MSFIRCLSNPEGLYIWGGRTQIFISQSGNTELRTVPADAWDKVFAKIKNSGFDYSEFLGEYVEIDGFRIQDIYENKKGQRILMSYNNEWEIEMWPVTFWSIEASANFEVPNPPPWQVLTGVYFWRKLTDWLGMSWYLYCTKEGRELGREDRRRDKEREKREKDGYTD